MAENQKVLDLMQTAVRSMEFPRYHPINFHSFLLIIKSISFRNHNLQNIIIFLTSTLLHPFKTLQPLHPPHPILLHNPSPSPIPPLTSLSRGPHPPNILLEPHLLSRPWISNPLLPSPGLPLQPIQHTNSTIRLILPRPQPPLRNITMILPRDIVRKIPHQMRLAKSPPLRPLHLRRLQKPLQTLQIPGVHSIYNPPILPQNRRTKRPERIHILLPTRMRHSPRNRLHNSPRSSFKSRIP